MANLARAEQLIIGAAIGQTAEQVRPFLRSLARSGYGGDVVLFVDRDLKRELRGDPESARVRLITARQWLPFRLGFWQRASAMRYLWRPVQYLLWIAARALERLVRDRELRFRCQFPLAVFACTPMEARFLRYRRFLAAHPHAAVLLTDVRDVLFQGDPFETLPAEGLSVSIESPAYMIATEPHNAAWVKRAYGPAMLERIGGKRVSCVGVTCGDRAAIAEYLSKLTGEILRLSPSRIGVGGADTAIHNVLVWTDRLGPVHRLEPLQSPVATFNGIDERAVAVSTAGRALNRDGSQPSVLHQYDRLPGLGARLLRALAG